MTNGGSDFRYERIDADAVCERCGTVNPEETLLCKTCGNNLRDQRARRISGDALPEVTAEKNHLALVTKVGTVILIVLAIWIAINANRISDYLMGVQSIESLGYTYWSSTPDKAAYESLLGVLQAGPITAEEIEQAQQPQLTEAVGLTGRYVVIQETLGQERAVVGQANVQQQGDRVLFVALVEGADYEIRGEAKVEAENRIVARETVGIKANDSYFGASGVVVKFPETGGYSISAILDTDERRTTLSYVAYRIP